MFFLQIHVLVKINFKTNIKPNVEVNKILPSVNMLTKK
jgi:hypothetical protein